MRVSWSSKPDNPNETKREANSFRKPAYLVWLTSFFNVIKGGEGSSDSKEPPRRSFFLKETCCFVVNFDPPPPPFWTMGYNDFELFFQN
jgi:hypothetical protein